MSQGLHKTKTCFDAKWIVGCSCDLNDKKLDKNVCTHSMSLIISIFAFLHDGFAIKIRLNDEDSV